VNLQNLDDFIARRQKAAEYYNDRLGSNPYIRIPKVFEEGTHIYHQYTILLDPILRDSVRNKLKERGIPSTVYYPVPLSLQKVFAFAGYREGDFPITENVCKSVLSLPIHTEMDEEQLDTICTNLLNILEHE
ncbi:MAG: transcriptional regulator, partial [Porphyromonadaceae bacterium]